MSDDKARPKTTPPLRWSGSLHSPSGAIRCAARLLESAEIQNESLEVGELVGICSELIYRVTGERKTSRINEELAASEASLIVWMPGTPPDHLGVVLVRLESGCCSVAMWSDELSAWLNDFKQGAHPGEWVEYTATKRGGSKVVHHIDKVVAWAELPITGESYDRAALPIETKWEAP